MHQLFTSVLALFIDRCRGRATGSRVFSGVWWCTIRQWAAAAQHRALETSTIWPSVAAARWMTELCCAVHLPASQTLTTHAGLHLHRQFQWGVGVKHVQTKLLASHQKWKWDCSAGLGNQMFPLLNSPPHLDKTQRERKLLFDIISVISTMTAGCPWAKTMSESNVSCTAKRTTNA